MIENKAKKVLLMTHISYDSDGSYFIGSAIPMMPTSYPKHRITGYYGRQVERKANAFLWKKIKDVYNKSYSKVLLTLNDFSEKNSNQALDDIPNCCVLNIPLAQVSLTDQLDAWSDDNEPVRTASLTDRDVYRRIARNPEIINKFFARPELSHIKAIIWPAVDPDNNAAYCRMITIRSPDVIDTMEVFNFEQPIDNIEYRTDL